MTTHSFRIIVTAADSNGDTIPLALTYQAETADAAREEAQGHPLADRWTVGTVTEVPTFPNAI